jgi:hypothetical protein
VVVVVVVVFDELGADFDFTLVFKQNSKQNKR